MSKLDIDILCESLSKETINISEKNHMLLIEEHIPIIFKIYSNKNKKHLYNSAFLYCKKIIDHVDSWYTPNIANVLCNIINTSMKTEKEYAFLLLDYLIEKNTTEIRSCMPELVPFITSFIGDVIQNIKQYSSNVLEKILKCSGNIDLDSFIPIVLNGIKDHNNTYNAVESLA